MARYLTYGSILIFRSHYYRGRAGARAVDLPARSFDLARWTLLVCSNLFLN